LNKTQQDKNANVPSKKKKKNKHKTVEGSSKLDKNPNSVSISDAETESGSEKDDSSDKEEAEKEPEKHAKNARYTKEDFVANKHGNEREPWVQKPMSFPHKKLKTKEEEHDNKFCEWMKPLFLQIPREIFLMRKYQLCLLIIPSMVRVQRSLETQVFQLFLAPLIIIMSKLLYVI